MLKRALPGVIRTQVGDFAMTRTYRVVDLRTGIAVPSEIIVEGENSPERAAKKALGLDLVRSGSKRDLTARVYWQVPDQPLNMVRLYTKSGDR